MFRFVELELHGWDFWPAIRVPLDGEIVVLSGPNGSGKTTILDAIRQILNATKLSQSRRLAHYLRRPNQPALVRAVVTNRNGVRGRRPFDVQRIHTDEATLACAIVPNGGIPEKRFAVLPGRVPAQDLQEQLLNGREWLRPEQYRRILDHAGVSRSLMHILALEQGRADELSRKTARELYRWVMEARGSQQVLERYNVARVQYQESLKEVSAQKMQVVSQNAELAQIERSVRRLDDYELQMKRLSDAEALLVAAQLAAKPSEARDIERKLPELRTKITNLVTSTDRLGREISESELELGALREHVSDARLAHSELTSQRDAVNARRAVLETNLKQTRDQIADLRSIPEEDLPALSSELETLRRQLFSDEEKLSALELERTGLDERMRNLRSGIPIFPHEVQQTVDALKAAGIACTVAATQMEVDDPEWTRAFESALGALRFALVVAAADYSKVIEIADRFNFPGPITTSVSVDASTTGCLRLNAGAPGWISEWLRSIQITTTGQRFDRFGAWVSKVDDFALGGNAIRAQFRSAELQLKNIQERRERIITSRDQAKATLDQLETRIRRQERRSELPALQGAALSLETDWQNASLTFDGLHARWTAANEAVLSAERTLDKAESALDRKREDLVARSAELQGTRKSVAEMELKVSELQPEIERLSALCTGELKSRVEAGEIQISPERAEGDVRSMQDSLERFRSEGSIPPATVREEKKLVQRNIEELERHVSERQREADAAREELDKCRGEYLNVIGSTLHDYRRRAYALADIAGARLEIEIPKLENDDKSIDEAGIFVRIGFDGKPPTEIGDTSHSGGQQVIAGLILLMAMAETEGDSFFIVDEPFAHLSLDRVDEVGRFLRGSGAQFLITVPTTLDRGQLDPASLLVVLRKKDPQEVFAPRPIVARA